MNTLVQISALLAGLSVFVLLTVISWAFDSGRRGGASRDRFIPGNYHPHGHHGDGDHFP